MRDEATSWRTQVKRAGERRNVSPSAARAFDILEYFGSARRPLRAIEIARRLELHPSTTNQLLKTLLESAHLVFDASAKTYLPSPRLARFSSWMIDIYGNDERLRRMVAEARQASDEVVTLTTPNDLFMQVIDLDGSNAAPGGNDSAERGLRVSIFGSAIGAAYLSTLPRAELLRLADRARIPEARHDEVLAQSAAVRIDGFAHSESVEGSIWSVAVPLPDDGTRVPLVLGVAGPADRLRTTLSARARSLHDAIDRYSSPSAPPRERS